MGLFGVSNGYGSLKRVLMHRPDIELDKKACDNLGVFYQFFFRNLKIAATSKILKKWFGTTKKFTILLNDCK